MGKLSDILRNGDGEQLRRAWNETDAAEDFAALPAGEYVADILGTALFNSRTNDTPGFKLTFQVAEGEHTGRRFWNDVWLTPAALPMAKRDLAKIGVTSLDQLEQPLPARLRCRVKLALRRDDDGSQSNRVKRFDVLEIVEPERDAFAPSDTAQDESEGNAAEAEGTDQDSPADEFSF